ncbi:MAG TPA: GerMN domain-containing protein [Aeromicrobium sp.]|nr:GerMN domain-containing protein [Aeromicrobium sp.]
MRTSTRWGWLAAVALLLGGCAGLPDSGPVERVATVGSRTHSSVRYEPARPRPGATPQQIVDGYLDAMLAYPEATGIVQSYLTPQAVEDWRSTAGITVYSEVRQHLDAVKRDEAEVRISARNTLKIDGVGRASVKSSRLTRTLRLERVAGHWRVANPVPGYLVTTRFAADYLRSYPLWFFDESGKRLVPELVHAVVGEQLPLILARRLADGPRGSTLRTYVPSADGLRVNVVGKIVEVDFDRDPGGATDKVAAQLLSTLRGVAGLDGVRILVDGVPKGETHPLDAVVGFGPGPLANQVYAIRSGRVVEITNHSRPINGPMGRSAGSAVAFAVDGATIAAVLRGRTSVTVRPRTGGAARTYAGAGFVDPVWDDDHGLWLVDNPDVARVRVVRDATVSEVDVGSLGRLRAFAVSPDRSRYAAVEQSGDDTAVVVGAIEHDADGAPVSLLPPAIVSAGRTGERSVGWGSPTRIDFVALGRSGQQLYSIGLDGADPAAGKPLRGGVMTWAGAAADGADRWALDNRGRLWRRSPGAAWEQESPAAYRALSAGR